MPRTLYGNIDGLGRAVDVTSEHLMQFALVPSTPEAPATEIIRALGHRLTEMSQHTEGSLSRPSEVRELPWPLPMSRVMSSIPPAGVQQPVALSVDTETGELMWLDADEDGPVFVVCGSSRSGRSNALVAAAAVMAQQGWTVLGLPLSRRSPLANGAFPGSIVGLDDLKRHADSRSPLALFIDDAHKWTGEVDGLRALINGAGDRAVVVAGPTEYFTGRSDLVRTLPSRCALVLAPRDGMDASQFGVRRLSEEVLRDSRPGRGVLVLAGEVAGAQALLDADGDRIAAVVALGLDETLFCRRGRFAQRAWSTSIVDVARGQLLDMVPRPLRSSPIGRWITDVRSGSTQTAF